MSTGKPTYWPTDRQKTPDLIDFFVIRKISKLFLKIEEGVDLNSDHSPIYLTLSSTVIDKSIPPHLCNKYTDWSYFKHILQKNAQYSCFPQNELEIDEELLKITQEIQDCLEKPIHMKLTSKEVIVGRARL